MIQPPLTSSCPIGSPFAVEGRGSKIEFMTESSEAEDIRERESDPFSLENSLASFFGYRDAEVDEGVEVEEGWT